MYIDQDILIYQYFNYLLSVPFTSNLLLHIEIDNILCMLPNIDA